MMHNPWTGMFGDAEDLRKEADTLDKIKEQLVGIYEDNSNLDAEAINELMDAETWLNPAEAKAFGFITDIDKAEKIAASYNKPVSEYGFLNTPNSEMPISFSKPIMTGNDVEPVVEVIDKEEVEELADMAKDVLDRINKLKINRVKTRINKIKKERERK
jgi:ATP-dependent Clp protease protease subunit